MKLFILLLGFLFTYLPAEASKPLLDNPSHNNKVFKELIEQAQLGNSEAQFLIGEAYDTGDITFQNKMKALKWYKLSGNQGHIKAQYNLGVMFQDGDGILQSNEKAMHWYLLAAKQDDADAQYALGYLYGEQDKIKAYAWLSLAESKGHQHAKIYVETMSALLSPDELIKGEALMKKYKQDIKSQLSQ